MFKPKEHEKPFSRIVDNCQIWIDLLAMDFNVYNVQTGENLLNTMNSNKAELYLDEIESLQNL